MSKIQSISLTFLLVFLCVHSKNADARLDGGSNESEVHERFPAHGTTETEGWLQTSWHQDGPYNIFCPKDPGSGERSKVGCVATALAQIVNFHRDVGELILHDGDSYRTSNNAIRIDSDSTTYDFPGFHQLNQYLDNIRIKYNTDNELTEDEIAAMNFVCGILLAMRYGSDDSYSEIRDVPEILLQEFGYETSESIVADAHTDFQDRIILNLINGLPVMLGFANHVGLYSEERMGN